MGNPVALARRQQALRDRRANREKQCKQNVALVALVPVVVTVVLDFYGTVCFGPCQYGSDVRYHKCSHPRPDVATKAPSSSGDGDSVGGSSGSSGNTTLPLPSTGNPPKSTALYSFFDECCTRTGCCASTGLPPGVLLLRPNGTFEAGPGCVTPICSLLLTYLLLMILNASRGTFSQICLHVARVRTERFRTRGTI